MKCKICPKGKDLRCCDDKRHHCANKIRNLESKKKMEQVTGSACPLKERNGRLVSGGAPDEVDFLNGEWYRCPDHPEISGRPHYIKQGQPPAGLLHLSYCWKTRAWQVSPRLGTGTADVLAMAQTDAEHPNTVPKSSWKLAATADGLLPCISFDVSCSGPNTPEEPFLIEELGRDFFIRAQPRKNVIWFECPRTGQTFHSGAKSFGIHKAGNRYCPICDRCFSANNFKSQHLRTHSRPLLSKKSKPALKSSSSSRQRWCAPQTRENVRHDDPFCTLEPLFADSTNIVDDASDQSSMTMSWPYELLLLEAIESQLLPGIKSNCNNNSFDPVHEFINSFPELF